MQKCCLFVLVSSAAPPKGRLSAGFWGDGNRNLWRKASHSFNGTESTASFVAEAMLVETGALADRSILGLPPPLGTWAAHGPDPVGTVVP